MKLKSKHYVQFVTVFIALSVIPLLYFAFELAKAEQEVRGSIESTYRSKLEFSQSQINRALLEVEAYSKQLSTNSRLFKKTISQPNAENIGILQEFWHAFLSAEELFTHLRYIDTDGNERIRVNYIEGSAELVEQAQLQNKAHRDYFRLAQSLPENSVGIFGIDPEMENGEIVMPVVPALRVIIPQDTDSGRLGYFIANVSLQHIYDDLTFNSNAAFRPEIIGEGGYYILSSLGHGLLGADVRQNADVNVKAQLPALWRQMQLFDSASAFENGHWYIFRKAQLPDLFTKLNLYLYFQVDHELLDANIDKRYSLLYSQALGTFLVTFLLAGLFVTWNIRHSSNSIESKLARAAMNSVSAMMICDENAKIIKVNPEFERLMGYDSEQVRGRTLNLFATNLSQKAFYKIYKAIRDDGVWEGEVNTLHRSGTPMTLLLRIQTVKGRKGLLKYYVASCVDITQRKSLENELKELSEKDPLTNIWNRRRFDQELTHYCNEAKRYQKQTSACLAILDIDHFKQINDEYGHDVGDKVIVAVTQQLKSQIRQTDFIARVGGEEFAVIMPVTNLEQAENVVNRWLKAVDTNPDIGVTLSAGITQISPSAEQSYKQADIALYEAKAAGRNCVWVFAPFELAKAINDSAR